MITFLMKKLILLFFLLINPSNAFHDTDVAEKDIAMLGGVYTQIIVYSQMCSDDQYYSQVINRLNESPRFLRYTQEMEHLSERQQLAWERGDLGASAVIESGGTDCETMASVIWEWFGSN